LQRGNDRLDGLLSRRNKSLHRRNEGLVKKDEGLSRSDGDLFRNGEGKPREDGQPARNGCRSGRRPRRNDGQEEEKLDKMDAAGKVCVGKTEAKMGDQPGTKGSRK
jgi:hypothetical protein